MSSLLKMLLSPLDRCFLYTQPTNLPWCNVKLAPRVNDCWTSRQNLLFTFREFKNKAAAQLKIAAGSEFRRSSTGKKKLMDFSPPLVLGLRWYKYKYKIKVLTKWNWKQYETPASTLGATCWTDDCTAATNSFTAPNHFRSHDSQSKVKISALPHFFFFFFLWSS